MLDGIKSNGWHVKQGNNISSSGKLYVLFNQHQPYVDQFFSQGRDRGWLSQTFVVPEIMSNFLGVFQQRPFPRWLREGGAREGLGFKPCSTSALPRSFVRKRFLRAKSCEQWDGSSGQGASRCHCQAAEMDPEPHSRLGTPGPGTAGRDTEGQWPAWWGALGNLLWRGCCALGLPGHPPPQGLKRCSSCRLGPGARSAARNCRLRYFV